MPEVLPTHTPALFAAAVDRAAALLRAGEAIALPTETVYGLAANALDPEAVRRIFRIKGRPASNPIIVHVAGTPLARQCSREWPADADRLARAFWPGPLTIVVPRSPNLPDLLTAGGPTVGLRWPSHPFIQAVIRTCGFPLAAPSANLSNAISPTCAAHVVASLGRRIPLVVDGGDCQVGIESTVVDITSAPARVLRPGMIHEESLRAVLPIASLSSAPLSTGVAPILDEPHRSPGQLPRHYSPRARLLPLHWSSEESLRRQLAEAGATPEHTHVLSHETIPPPSVAARICVIPHDPEAYARAMYAEWHRCDALGARWIVVELPPDQPAWRAILDRLRRAASPDSSATAPD